MWDTSDDQDLSLHDLEEATPALKNMFTRWRGDNKQMGRKKLGERFHLCPSQFGYLTDRYRVARNAGIDVQYKDLSETQNFKSVKGYTEKLRAKEPLLKALLKMALVEQREIDAQTQAKSIEDLEEEVAKLDVQHKEDLAKWEQHEVEIAELEEQHKVAIAKLEALHKVEIGNQQDILNRAEKRCNALKEVMTGRGKSPEFKGDVNELKKKEARLEEKANATYTKQSELVAFSNRLEERNSMLNGKEHEFAEQAKYQQLERERLESQWTTLESAQKRHDAQVRADQGVHAEWHRALNKASFDLQEAKSEANAMRDGWACERAYINALKLKLDSFAECCVTEHGIEDFAKNRNSGYLKMTRLEQCGVVVGQMEKVHREDAGTLRDDLDEFFQTRNLLCHQPDAVDWTDHRSFHERCNRIQHCLKFLENQSVY